MRSETSSYAASCATVALAFDAKFGFVAEASDPSGEHVRVISGWYMGDWMAKPFEYELERRTRRPR